MTDLSVSIIVRALNESAHLPALFEGIAGQSRPPSEVILVDSGSTDGSDDIAREHGAEVVRIAPEDFSFGRALNVGCEAATGDVFVFVSAHTYPLSRQWLAHLVAPFGESDVALVYGRQTGDHRSAFSELELLRRWFPMVDDDDQRTPFCNNANCAVRASVWRDLPYDEDLTGLEDLDWARRALDRGHRLVYRASAAVAHVHEETFSSVRNRYRREAIAYRKIMPAERMGAGEALALFAVSALRDIVASTARRRIHRDLTTIPRFRAAQYLGSWEGFRQRGEPSTELRRRFYYPKGFEVVQRRSGRTGHQTLR